MSDHFNDMKLVLDKCSLIKSYFNRAADVPHLDFSIPSAVVNYLLTDIKLDSEKSCDKDRFLIGGKSLKQNYIFKN